MVWESFGAFWQLQSGFHVPFTEECFPSGHFSIKAWLVEYCRDVCPSGRFSHLHTGTLELFQSDHQVLGHIPNQDTSPKMFLGTFNASDIFWYLSPDLCLDKILSRSSTDNSFDLSACQSKNQAISTVGPHIDRCVPFQIMSNHLNLPRVDSNQVVETSRMITGNRIHLISIESHSKGSEYLWK